jgi:uncharacterized protein YjbI with pentapeptide repeats
MAYKTHIAQLMKGPAAWNAWRQKNPEIRPDLRQADLVKANLRQAKLYRADLRGAILREANLSGASLTHADLFDAVLTGAYLSGAILPGARLRSANLSRAILRKADLSGIGGTFARVGADLSNATLHGANLNKADLRRVNLQNAKGQKAKLRNANLSRADLSGADLSGAQLPGADLTQAQLVGTILKAANITGCRVYGVSAWGVELSGAKQENLIISPADEPEARVDDLEVAQFFYLLLNRKKIRNVIDAVTRRGVLILGRFGDGGLALLQEVAAWLRRPENGGYLPLLFDFPRPEFKTYTDTVRTLVSLARFVIVDLSGPSVPQEITATVDLYDIPFVPILEKKREDWTMFRDFLVKERVLKPVRFTDQHELLELLAKEVIAPAEKLIEKRQKRLAGC